jgi:hypothetical protein
VANFVPPQADFRLVLPTKIAFDVRKILIDRPGNALLMRLYSIGGLLYTVYVIVATHRSAANCKSQRMASFVRISCIASLLILPLDCVLGT